MTDSEKVYRVLADHPRGVFADTLALAAEVNRNHISSTVCRSRRYCRRGYTVEGFTTRPRGMTQTRYKIVRDWSVDTDQQELIESEAA